MLCLISIKLINLEGKKRKAKGKKTAKMKKVAAKDTPEAMGKQMHNLYIHVMIFNEVAAMFKQLRMTEVLTGRTLVDLRIC